jgi:hypothetical protein
VRVGGGKSVSRRYVTDPFHRLEGVSGTLRRSPDGPVEPPAPLEKIFRTDATRRVSAKASHPELTA